MRTGALQQSTQPVLVIEDDDELRSEIVEYLKDRRHHAIGCPSLAAASELLVRCLEDSSPPLAVVSDVGLGDGNGFDFFLEWANRFEAVRWILMSGSHDFEHLQKSLIEVAGVRAPTVVEKPVALSVLNQLIDQKI